MKRSAKPRRSTCPFDYALEIFGDRWTLLVLRDLLFSGKRYFREFSASEEGIATNILTDRLKKLEAWDMVSRSRDPESGRQIIYHLTDKGLALTPAMLEIIRWSAKYDPRGGAPAAFIRRIKRDRDAVAAEIIARARRARPREA
jgi:DNA-binding HxlR family transcriptional regulator